MPDVKVFHAGTALQGGQVLTSGGRVLGVTALGESIAKAKLQAYTAVKCIRWDGAWCRKDISDKAFARGTNRVAAGLAPRFLHHSQTNAGQAPPLSRVDWHERHHKRPPLLWFSLFERVPLHVFDRFEDSVVRMKKDIPPLAGPWRWRRSVCLPVGSQRVDTFQRQLLCRTPFQMSRNLLGPVLMAGDYQMGMFGQDGTRVDHVPRLFNRPLEPDGDRQCLFARERDGRIPQGPLRLHPGLLVVAPPGHGVPGLDLGGLAETQQFPLAYPIRP